MNTVRENNINPAQDDKETFLKDCYRNVKSYFSEFCNNTSIHGFRFLGETNRSSLEKIWWLVVVTLSLYGCINLISQTYKKWVTSPVIVSFATSQTPISDIPFPAVTICSDIKSSSNLFNFSAALINITGENITEEEFQNYHYMNMVCEKGAGLNNSETRFADDRCLDFITKVAPSLNETIKSVTWRGHIYNDVQQYFTPIFNSEGVCYSFNILDRNDLFSEEGIRYKNFFLHGNSSTWNIEEGYKNSMNKRYPRSSAVSGIVGGIDIVLYASDNDIDYECSPDFVGFKVTIQHPALYPRGRKHFITVPLDQIVLGSIKPIMMKTSKELRDYSSLKRQCHFITEKSLRFFKTYNQPNCLLECLANATLDSCGCVGFYMPGDNSTPICGSGSRRCMEKAEALYLSGDFKTKRTTLKKYTETYKKKCNCLPSCSALDFEVEVSQSQWNWQRVYPNTSSGCHYSRLRLFFKDMQFIRSVRKELYGTTDFLASCGGLLGLFMGFSTISLFEIFYFLTLRLFCNIRKYGKYYWSGAK